MKAQVDNFRGAISVRFELADIVMLAGRNGAGKSSVTEAIGLLLTGLQVPPGLPKNRAAMLVRKGQEKGRATVWGDGMEAELRWPECETRSQGDPPSCSEIAAGLLRPTRYLGGQAGAKEFWARLLKADVTAADFNAAVVRMGMTLPPKTQENIVRTIERDGAEKTHADLKDRLKELKGRWEQASGGGRWGEKKAEDFMPVGLDRDMEYERAVNQLAAMREAKKNREVRALVSAEDRVERQARVDGLQAAQESGRAATLALAEAQSHLDATPAPNERQPIPCPHCGGPLDLISEHGGAQHRIVVMEARAVLPADKLKAMRLARQQAEHAVEKARTVCGESQRALDQITRDIDWLRKNQPAGGEARSLQDDRLFDDEISTLARACEAHRVWTEAHDINRQIKAAQVCVDLTDPKGPIVAEKIAAQIKHLNQVLDGVRDAAGFGETVLHRDDEGAVTLTLNGRPYALLSAGERAAVDITLQIAMATVDGSQIVLVDNAEALDAGGWNGVLGALKGKFVAVLAYTASKREAVPDLAAAGLGATYWMRKGEIVA